MTNALWYLGRGFGVSALVIFSLVTALGLLVRSGRPLPGLPRFAVTSIHRSLSLAGLALLGVHILSLLADPYAQLRVTDVLLPFLGRRRPMWLGLGTLALDLVVVLVVSSLLRDRIGLRAWRALHWLAYACWPVAILHAVGTGTDRSRGWLQLIEACCVLTVTAALLIRLAVRRAPPPRPVQPPRGLAGLR